MIRSVTSKLKLDITSLPITKSSTQLLLKIIISTKSNTKYIIPTTTTMMSTI